MTCVSDEFSVYCISAFFDWSFYIIKVAFAIGVRFLMADNIFDVMNLDFTLLVPLITLFSNNRAFVATLIFIVCELSHV